MSITNHKIMTYSSGFVMFELLVAIIIIALISVVSITIIKPGVSKKRTQDAISKQKLSHMAEAIESFRTVEQNNPIDANANGIFTDDGIGLETYLNEWPNNMPEGARYLGFSDTADFAVSVNKLSSTGCYVYSSKTGVIMDTADCSTDILACIPTASASLVAIATTTSTPTPTPTNVVTPTPTPTISPTPTVTITPPPNPTPTPIPVLCSNAVVGLTLDRSSSLQVIGPDGRRLIEWEKDAAKAVVQSVINSGVTTIKFTVDSFGSQGNDGTGTRLPEYNSSLEIGPTTNYSAVLTAINGVQFIQSGTCVECGLRIVREQIQNNPSKKFIMLFTDGNSTRVWDGTTTNPKPAAVADANLGRTKGIEYWVIGYGTPGPDMQTMMNDIAKDSSHYMAAPTQNDWANAFISVFNSACQSSASP